MKIYEINKDGLPDVQPVKFYNTNISEFDTQFGEEGSICAQGLTVIGGTSGCGKSIVLMQLALNMSLTHKILYISLENSENCDKSRMSNILMRYNLSESDCNFIYVTACDGVPVADGETKVQTIGRIIDKYNPEMLFIDAPEYLCEIGDDEWAMYSRMVESLVNLIGAKKIGCVISWQLKFSAISKKNEDLTMEDFGSTRRVCQTAVQVYAMNPGVDNHRKLRLIKSRENVPLSAWYPLDIETSEHYVDLRGSNV